ncbi:MAG: sigma factor-like helix-turn-helix DNA-binding protein [Solibacillus sp.]
MVKVIFKTYRDILATIEITKAEMEALQLDLDYWIGKNSDHPLLSQGAAKYGLDVAANRSNFLYERMGKLEGRLKGYEEIEKEIRENIENLHGLEHKIAKLRFIKGLTYEEIADQLGYSYGYIRTIVSKGDNQMPKRLAQ